jgi:ceramide glucosyltransferase
MSVHSIALNASVAIAGACLVYQGLACGALLWWRGRRRRRPADILPPITVLKPLCGLEADLEANLRSFCVQDYPRYQVILGARDPGDPALEVARRLAATMPDADISVVADPTILGGNLKVSNVANLARHARYDHLVLADSDVRVPPDLLRTLAHYLAQPILGSTSCPFRARPTAGFWSRMGAMAINEWLTPAGLVTWMLGLRIYSAGATLAFRRDVLDRIGGFAARADELADDYQLAARARALGYRTALAPLAVETTVDEPGPRALVLHELRWLRTIRAVQPVGHAAMLLSFAIPLAFLPILLGGPSPVAPGLALAALALRGAIHLLAPRSDREPPFVSLLLVPIRDPLLLLLWCASLLGRRVVWRGVTQRVTRLGKVA